MDKSTYRKITIIKGKTYTLKSSVILTGAGSKTLLYSTSNKKVAAVSKKGKISAKKTGSATIKVKL